MGWQLAGLEVDRGREVHAPDPGEASQAWSTEAAAAVGERFGVAEVDLQQVDAWQADEHRTTYVLDVRTPEEFAAGHLPGSRNAPGGQLVQATDEYVATWNARLVLVDDNGVRATMTASWMRQLGWDDTVVLAGDVTTMDVATDPPPRPSVGPAATIKVCALAELLATDPGSVAVLDIGSSLKYRKRGHIPGAWWGVRSRHARLFDVGGRAGGTTRA